MSCGIWDAIKRPTNSGVLEKENGLPAPNGTSRGIILRDKALPPRTRVVSTPARLTRRAHFRLLITTNSGGIWPLRPLCTSRVPLQPASYTAPTTLIHYSRPGRKTRANCSPRRQLFNNKLSSRFASPYNTSSTY